MSKQRIPVWRKKTTEDAYLAGFDCGKNGTNMQNSNFSLFATPEMTRMWERGRKAGEIAAAATVREKQ